MSSSLSLTGNNENKFGPEVQCSEWIPAPAITSDSSWSDDGAFASIQNLRNNASFTIEDISKYPRELARKIDWITRCNNPVEFLQTLGFYTSSTNNTNSTDTKRGTGTDKDTIENTLQYNDNHDHYFEIDEKDQCCIDDDPVVPYVVFHIPQYCEYCGAPSPKDCDTRTCSRPSTFFPKQRPPFSPPDPKIWPEDDTIRYFVTTHRYTQKGKRDQNPPSRIRPSPPIRSRDHWRIAGTPKTKNKWIAPTVDDDDRTVDKERRSCGEGDADALDTTSTTTCPKPRLLFSEMDETKRDGPNIQHPPSVAVASLNSIPSTSFFPVSTREVIVARRESTAATKTGYRHG